MARPRTPTNVLRLRGGFRKHKGREEARADEPVPTAPLGDPPRKFTKAQRDAWEELVRIQHAGVFSEADRVNVEMAAELLAFKRSLKGAHEMPTKQLAMLVKLLASFGMTPADRSRVKGLGAAKKKNPFEEIRDNAA